MDHVAILRKSRVSKGDNLLGDILEGTKTIESRWYVNKVSPWDNIKRGDTVYFKESGCPVTAKAEVSRVLQYDKLDEPTVQAIINKYGRYIAPRTPLADLHLWGRQQTKKRYCILIVIKDVVRLKPFDIDKTGYGVSSAWLAVGDIAKVKVRV
jgi:ASC-1-like (ASCH) protein